MTTWADIIEHAGSAAVYASIAPAVLGGVMTFFKQWIPSEEVITQKIDFAKAQLRAELESSLRRVLGEFMSFEMQDRNASETDSLASYSKQQMTVVRLVQRFESVRHRIANGYTVLLISAIMAVLFFAVALVFKDARPVVTALALVTILVQVWVVCRMFLAKRVLDHESRDLWK